SRSRWWACLACAVAPRCTGRHRRAGPGPRPTGRAHARLAPPACSARRSRRPGEGPGRVRSAIRPEPVLPGRARSGDGAAWSWGVSGGRSAQRVPLDRAGHAARATTTTPELLTGDLEDLVAQAAEV